jgi:hypothetical protein
MGFGNALHTLLAQHPGNVTQHWPGHIPGGVH